MNKVLSVVEYGSQGLLIDVECHLSRGLPAIVIVGSASRAVDEARERVRSAFASSRLILPRRRITLNLAPADVPKESTSFDLAMAAAILLANDQVAPEHLEDLLNTPVIGELELNGSLRPVRGIIGKLLAGRRQGYNRFYIPAGNLLQARLVPGLTLVPIKHLSDLSRELSGAAPVRPVASGGGPAAAPAAAAVDLADVVGQERAKRALEIAAAGAHNLLLSGPPGTGKSLLAKALPGILPSVTPEEMLEITHLHSLAGYHFQQIMTSRPFRAPHHSTSRLALIGGGGQPRPGEVSLSHRGVLFLDELPEFGRSSLEALRQPLEDQVIVVTRAKDSLTFPAKFMLVATANPCPCGYFGTDKACICQPFQVIRYQQKLSGPILDRIDLYISVEAVKHRGLLQPSRTQTGTRNQGHSAAVRKRVEAARARQQQRYADPMQTNAWLTNKQIKQYCQLAPEARQLLDQAAERLSLSPRSYLRTLKVARTIADLDGKTQIKLPHLAEALQYREQPGISGR